MSRILIIHNNGNWSGPGISLRYLLKYLGKPHDIDVLVSGTGEFTEQLDRMGLSWSKFSFRYRHLFKLMWIMLINRYQIIYGNSFCLASWHALIAAKATRRKFIWHIRETFNDDASYRKYERLRYADKVIAVSHSCARSINNYNPDIDVVVAHNGIDVTEVGVEANAPSIRKWPESKFLVLNVGHLCERKNQVATIEIAKLVCWAHPDVRFYLMGRLDHSPGYTKKVRELIHEYRLEDHVVLLGNVTDPQFKMAESNVLLHTASNDPHPRAILEAMSCGLPVVSFSVDGVTETVVDGETGFLHAVGDISGSAESIVSLVLDEEKRVAMGLRSSQLIKSTFTALSTARKVDEVINTID